MTAKPRKTTTKPESEVEEKASDQLIAEAAEIIGDIDLTTAPRLNPSRALTPGNKFRAKSLVDRYNGLSGDTATDTDVADLFDDVTDFLARCAVNRAEYDEWLVSDAAVEQTFPLFINLVKSVGESQRSSN